MSISEVRNQVNITIDFMLKLPASEKTVFYDTNVQVYEDMSAFRVRLKVQECKMVTDQVINIAVCIPNYEQGSFKGRTFEICFE